MHEMDNKYVHFIVDNSEVKEALEIYKYLRLLREDGRYY
jgi:hypothetical protein